VGIARPQEWLDVARRHGVRARLLALDPSRFPHDIATLGRYGQALAGLPGATRPWSPLQVPDALANLGDAAVEVAFR
jgi:hypothetical protein